MRLLGCLALLSFYLDSVAQVQPYNKAFIWRGFSHQWTYNHRCNRIGDYVVYNNNKPITAHTSATGKGADSTYFTSYYSFVASQNVAFKEGKVTIQVNSKEKRLVEGNIDVSVE